MEAKETLTNEELIDMNNLKEIKTTIVGLILWIATGLYFITPFFNEKELWEVNNTWVISGVIGGLLLLLAPDRLLKFLFGWLDRKTGKGE